MCVGCYATHELLCGADSSPWCLQLTMVLTVPHGGKKEQAGENGGFYKLQFTSHQRIHLPSFLGIKHVVLLVEIDHSL